jgi:hypothetical protein
MYVVYMSECFYSYNYGWNFSDLELAGCSGLLLVLILLCYFLSNQ